MATKESQCLTKEYVMKMYGGGGGGGTGPVILNFGSTHRGECSVCGRGSPGKGHKVLTGLGIGRAELKAEEKKHFCCCSSRAMIPQCSSWPRHSAEINLLKTKCNLLYIRNQPVPRCKHFPPRL
jgi:hypothetical protein